jgi:hypothetical protein
MAGGPDVEIQTSESKIRLIAFFVMLLGVVYIITGTLLVPLFLVIDFSLRSFDLGKYSPMAALSGLIVRVGRLPVKPVYLPPKRFAARMGLTFCVLIVVLHLIGINALIPACILTIFAALESLAGFCAGCYVYDWMVRLRH